MPHFMFTFSYSPETWAGLVRSPENREEIVARILESSGCTLHGLWYAFGDTDGFALMEAPDNKTAAALAVAIGSSGAFSKFQTTPLMTMAEALDALEIAQGVGYTRPSEAVPA